MTSFIDYTLDQNNDTQTSTPNNDTTKPIDNQENNSKNYTNINNQLFDLDSKEKIGVVLD
jgi:hypothetical protein